MLDKKITAAILLLVMLFSSLCGCRDITVSNTAGVTDESTTATGTESTGTATSDPEPVAIDIETIGGVVIIGTIGHDEHGWYIQPEQPLNITFNYFIDSPSVFPSKTRIDMIDPKVDGVEKAAYIGQTVTASGTFRFLRDDFETLYFAPYTITIGKNAEKSYSAPDLVMPDEPEDLYDPTEPLPKYMDPMLFDGKYAYNAFMLSEETLRLMGNDFALFYVGFVDAFLSYSQEFECPDKHYAEMLSTIIYYEFPLFNACAESFEFFKHYDAEKGVVKIEYKYDKAQFNTIVDDFMNTANELLANTNPDQTDEQKARAIYHAISTRMTYDYSALEKFERKESYYAYLYGTGVCITFANVYNQLLTQVGIKTTLAHCDTNDYMGHIWSIITLDGKQYFCDPTYELSYDGGSGYRFYGMNYADRTAGGLGESGIRYGRYNVNPLTFDMIAAESLEK